MGVVSNLLAVGFLLSFSCLIKITEGGATMQIRFLTFNNPGGKGSNGHCCDGKSIFCFSQCDHKFTVCLDHANSRSSNPYLCPNGRVISDRVHDRNYITFGSWFGRIRNPMVYDLAIWPGAVKLKVRIVDYDPVGPSDHVDDLSTILSLPAARSYYHATAKEYVLRQRTTLRLWVKVYCDPHYYGDRCAIYCAKRDDDHGHYNCDIDTGEKLCYPGWSGEDCNLPVDECGSSPCRNGGLCADKHNSYYCLCPRGFLGHHCEVDFDECGSNPCRNGGVCEDGVDSYKCVCDSGYIGPNCETNVMPCTFSPCENNGTCVNLNNTDYLCVCPKGFMGADCEDLVPTTTTTEPTTTTITTTTTTVPTTTASTAAPTTVSSTTEITSPNSTVAKNGRDTFAMSVMVNGRRRTQDLMIIKQWLTARVTETNTIDITTMSITITVQECMGENGPVTELYISIKYDPTGLTPRQIEFVIRHVSRSVKSNFLFDTYRGNECKAVQVAAITTEKHKTWIEKYWALLLSGGGGTLLIVLVLIGVFVCRRRRRKHSVEQQAEGDDIETYDSIDEEGPPLPPRKYSTADANVTQAFGNAIYLDPDHQPLTTNGTREEDAESLYDRIDEETEP